MRYSDDYLKIKKIVAIEEISKMILNNKECWDVDLRSFVINQEVIDTIGAVLASGKSDEHIVKEIRNLFDKYETVC